MRNPSQHPLVLIHGTSLDASSNFGHVIDRFPQHSQVVCPNYLADERLSSVDVDLDTAVDQVISQITAATDGPFDLAGDSLGSVVAAAVAARYPNLVRRLVLIAPWAESSDPRHSFVFSTWGRLQATSPEAATRFALTLSLSPNAMAAIAQADLDAMALQAAPAGTLSRIHLGTQINMTGELPKITARTLIISGNQDYVIPAYQTAAVEALIPGAKTEVLDSGHALLYEQTDQVVRLINEFTAENEENNKN